MKIHVVGGGGRVHTLVWKLLQSLHVTGLYCAPGNAGIAGERLLKGNAVICFPVGPTDIKGQLALAKEQKPDLTIVSEDDPLALGIADIFQREGLRIWGPSRRAARFEWSKVFSQRFMEQYGVPVAPGFGCNLFSEALKWAEEFGWRAAIKASGLALGKGALICRNEFECREAARRLMIESEFGPAGDEVVVQELQDGTEASLHFLCDGIHTLPFPSSKDYKRVFDHGEGGMTGGMGTVSPSPFLGETEFEQVAQQIIEPWLHGCREEKIDFRGVLYPGIMMTANGPCVLELNARFGDPETQVYLTRLENDLIELLEASLNGTLNKIELRWKPETSVCVVLASRGYPDRPETRKEISGLDEAVKLAKIKVFHAGTKCEGGRWYTNGGRVLGVTAWGKDAGEARDQAYAAAECITFDGRHYRKDIGE